MTWLTPTRSGRKKAQPVTHHGNDTRTGTTLREKRDGRRVEGAGGGEGGGGGG